MKKIFKIFLVFLIAFNFVISNTVKIKAVELAYIPWSVDFVGDSGKWYVGQYIAEGNGWWVNTDDGDYINRMEFSTTSFATPLKNGEVLYFTGNIDVGGIMPTNFNINYYLISTDNKRISLTFKDEEINESMTMGDYGFIHHINKLEWTNNTQSEYSMLLIVYSFLNGRNTHNHLIQVTAEGIGISKSAELIQKENAENVSGIFETVKKIFTGITELPTNIANSVKGFFDNVVNSVTNIGNMITNGLTTLGNFIIDGLKSLFIPSDQYFKNYFDSLYEFFSNKLGILIMPIDILGSLMNNILNLENGDGYIHIPQVKFMDHTLIPKTDYNLKVDVEQVMGNYYEMYYLLTDVIIYFMLFNMAKKKFDEIVRGAN